MPTTTGSSATPIQTLQNFQALTLAQVALEFPDTPILPFERVGVLYVWVVQSTTPFQTRLLAKTPIYRPGIFITYPNNYGFSAVRYTFQAKWDRSGINWRIITQ
jgi:hypothetical protein